MGKIADSTHNYSALCSSNQLEPLCSHYVIMKTQCVSLFIAQTIVFKSKRIRLDLDCTVASEMCEIDAVKIDGNICSECMLHTLSLIVIQIENMMLAIINFYCANLTDCYVYIQSPLCG